MKKFSELQKGDIIEIDRDRLVVFDSATFGNLTTIQFANSGEIMKFTGSETTEVYGNTDIFTYPLQKPETKHINYEHRRLALKCASQGLFTGTKSMIEKAEVFERWLNGETIDFETEEKP